MLKSLPQTWRIYLAKKFKNTFYHNERIVRFIYSEENFNSKTQTLKANFVQFRVNKDTNQNELSCNRFEFETVKRCEQLAKLQEDGKRRIYYGLGCAKVSHILEWQEHTLAYTPLFDQVPPNHYHTDIYDHLNKPQLGQANTAEALLKRELFKEIWRPYHDNGNLKKNQVIPFNSFKEIIESLKKVS